MRDTKAAGMIAQVQDAKPKMKKVLLDTNFFLAPFQLGVNILSELDRVVDEPHELMTLSPMKAELEKLAKTGKGDDKLSAKLALELARNIQVIDAPGSGDRAILDYAKAQTERKDLMVATNDSALRKSLKTLKIRTVFVRNRSKLELE